MVDSMTVCMRFMTNRLRKRSLLNVLLKRKLSLKRTAANALHLCRPQERVQTKLSHILQSEFGSASEGMGVPDGGGVENNIGNRT